MIKRWVCLLSVLILGSGCASLGAGLRAWIPGGVTAADSEWLGSVAGQPQSLVGLIDPSAGGLALNLVQGDPLGVLLPLNVEGEGIPRWVVCAPGEEVRLCRSLELHQRVRFAGSMGAGGFWHPSRLKPE